PPLLASTLSLHDALPILGMIPYSFTVTSHIIVTFALAALVFVVVTAIGFARHGLGYLKLFVPEGVPFWLMPLIVPIELISYLIRDRKSTRLNSSHVKISY